MNLGSHLTKPAAVALAAFFAMAASPAAANGTTSAQVTGAIDVSRTSDAPLATRDEEFSELFANWGNTDEEDKLGSRVAVPSRMPMDDLVMTSGYGMRNHPILGKRRKHNGVDLAAPRGTPVYATADGLVGKAQYFGSYGNYVQIEHGGEYETRYAHLSRYTVEAGEKVKKGELIGYVGTTGRSTGPHLHYEVRLEGEPLDPRPYMVQAEIAMRDDVNAQGGPDEE